MLCKVDSTVAGLDYSFISRKIYTWIGKYYIDYVPGTINIRFVYSVFIDCTFNILCSSLVTSLVDRLPLFQALIIFILTASLSLHCSIAALVGSHLTNHFQPLLLDSSSLFSISLSWHVLFSLVLWFRLTKIKCSVVLNSSYILSRWFFFIAWEIFPTNLK